MSEGVKCHEKVRRGVLGHGVQVGGLLCPRGARVALTELVTFEQRPGGSRKGEATALGSTTGCGQAGGGGRVLEGRAGQAGAEQRG